MIVNDISTLEIVPISLKEANIFVSNFHRHNKPVIGHKFSMAVSDGEKIVGVCIVGRPIARYLDDGWTLEVNRTCTNGEKNVNSMLYAAAWRAAQAIGYKRLITYTLPSESGSSLKGAGFKILAEKCGGGTWNRKSRLRIDITPNQFKIRWGKETI